MGEKMENPVRTRIIREARICLPFYKIACAAAFTVILSLIRAVSYSYEAGPALEPPLALLAAALCADTYAQEISSGRSEIWRLCPVKRKVRAVFLRTAVQWTFLLALSSAGYGLIFLFQRPLSYDGITAGPAREGMQFLLYMGAIAVTLGFWGILSGTLACLLGSTWGGIGGCLVLWVMTNSTLGDRYLGDWNLFSYTFRDIGSGSDLHWICGKIACILLGAAMTAALPKIMKKRG